MFACSVAVVIVTGIGWVLVSATGGLNSGVATLDREYIANFTCEGYQLGLYAMALSWVVGLGE